MIAPVAFRNILSYYVSHNVTVTKLNNVVHLKMNIVQQPPPMCPVLEGLCSMTFFAMEFELQEICNTILEICN